MSKKASIILFLLFIAWSSFFFYGVSSSIPMIEDDFSNLQDIKGHFLNYTTHWNARIGNLFRFLQGSIDPLQKGYPSINTFINLGNIFLIFSILRPSILRIFSFEGLSSILLIFYFYTFGGAVSGETLFWKSGFFNYPFHFFFLLSFIFYIKLATQKKLCHRWYFLEVIFFIFSGLIVGSGFENIQYIIFMALSIFILLVILGKISISYQSFRVIFQGYLSFILGVFMSLVATYNRWLTAKKMDHLTHSFTENIVNNFSNLLHSFNIIIFLVIFCYLLTTRKNNKNLVNFFFRLSVIIVASLLPLLIAGRNDERALFIPTLVPIAGIIIFFQNQKDIAQKILLTCVFVISSFFCYKVLQIYFMDLYPRKQEIIKIHRQQLVASKKSVTLPYFIFENKNYGFFQKYLKKNKIQFLDTILKQDNILRFYSTEKLFVTVIKQDSH